MIIDPISGQQGSLDQHQDNTGASFGFGQGSLAGQIKYRGQCFTPAVDGLLGAIAFDRDQPSIDIKVYIDSTSAHIPNHLPGSELYSFTIPNAQIPGGFKIFQLPTPLLLSAGVEYCFYLAPWNISTNSYQDDYHDTHGISGGGLELTWSINTGTLADWSNENLTFRYSTFMIQNGRLVNINNLRPRSLAPGRAL